MTKKLTVTIELEEGTKRNYLSVAVDEGVTEKMQTILGITRGEPRATLDALSSTLKAKLL